MSDIDFDRSVTAAPDAAGRAMTVAEQPPPPSRELLPAAASRLTHTIDLRQDRTVQFTTILSAAAVFALLAGLWLGKFSKTETARGIVASSQGFSRLDAPRAGFIKQVYVAQGDHVAAGTPIYLLGIGELNAGGDSAVASEMKALLLSRGNQTTEIERATEVRLKRVEYKRQAADKQRELATLIAEKQSQASRASNEINSIDARIGHLKTESVLQVQAQSAGEVLAVTGKVGDSVEAGQFVAAVGEVNAEPLIVLDAPARATGLVKVGQKVVLKYDAFPFKTFGIQHGTITSISSAAIRSPATEGDSGLDPRPVSRQSLYRIEVRPDSDEIEAYGEKKKIALGSTLSADIIVEKRRLIDWVLDPIRAMRGRT